MVDDGMEGAARGVASGSTQKEGETMSALMRKLNLTVAEASQIAIAGKVLSVNEFHIQTITNALRPQWGNPRGLKFQAMGDNVFVATMDSEKDRGRTWDGFPWMINKHAATLMRLILRTPLLHLTSAARYKIVSVAPNIILHLKISIASSTIIYTASRIDIGPDPTMNAPSPET
jgi:hypothetical protein